MLLQARRDLVYLLPTLAISLASFTVLIACVMTSVPLAIVWVGVPLLAVALGLAKWFADVERRRVRVLTGLDLPPVYYRPTGGGTLPSLLVMLRDPQRWRDLAHGMLVMPLSMITWILAIFWAAIGVTGTLYPLYGWAMPRYPGSIGVNDLIGFHGYPAAAVANLLIGIVFLATGIPVWRGLAGVHAAFARVLLTNEKAALRARAEHLSASRTAAVQAEAQTLRRVERDIHDGPQQRLVRLTMDLESVRRRLDDNPDAARGLVDEALTQSREALSELRAVSRGIAPPILADRGLGPALAAAAARCPVDTTVECELPEGRRLPEAVENAAYFVVSEALTNVAKHAGASRCAVTVTAEASTLWLRVTDDGVGGAHLGKGHGLAGLVDRLAAVDGRLDVHSPTGGPTVLTAEIPVNQ
ncbi:sensor histidine kinase [Kutzneria viridogrisea]|uniref:histidine kinase n=1 Tax=Kutzneria viridogrisea TaxID=47990 RepID=A0ABR6B8R7_9PSEU|nr:signal transduction histidine kinase [Kutzneria viridogrisea]